MKFKRFIILLVVPVLMSSGLPKGIKKRVDKSIKSTFSVSSFELTPKLFSEEIQNTLAAPFGHENLFEINSESDRIGYLYIGKAFGKTDNFDYMILFDSELIIVQSKVLIYREDYGGEISSKRWLKQFNGKDYNDELKLHRDIIAISGATISVRSMTKSINNVLASLKTLRKKEQL